MSVITITRFAIDPANADALQVRHASLVAAIRFTAPGLTTTQLAKLDDTTWLAVWHWDSPESLEHARAVAPNLPEAAEAFALADDVTTEQATIIDAR